MKANELMIGDWVIGCSGEPFKIGIIDPDFLYWNEVQPIPLTPEILEKNGFEYKEKELGLYGVTTAPHYVRDDVPFEVFCDGEPFAIWFKEPVNIKFVHELQHALRLCGIEKEIEL